MMIKKLSDAYAPSAKEEEARKIIVEELKDFYADIKIDALGNLIIHKPGNYKTIAITAPMDEVSFLVTHNKKESKVILTSICDVKSKTLQNLMLKDEINNLFIINKTPNNSDEIGKIRNVEAKIANYCKANTLDNCFFGKSLVYKNNFTETNELYLGKALERSVTCSLLCDVARNVSSSMYEYYFVFSAQNYCDKKGALTATYNLKIDELYSLCCIDADNESVEVGKGPVVVVRDKMLISDIDLVNEISNYPHMQKLISSNFISEAGYYQKQHTTQKIISVGIATDFLSCSNEVISKNDVHELKSLILEKVLP